MVNFGSLGEVSILIRAKDEFSRTLSGMQREIKGFSAAAAADFRKVGAGLTAFGVAGATAIGGVVSAAAGLEQTRTAFTTLLGSAEEAEVFLKDLGQFAARTPFEVTGVRESAKTLLAMGFSAEEVLPTLKSVGDVAGGLGLNQEGLQRLIFNLGQVQTQGQLTGVELKDFTRNGVPIIEALANVLDQPVDKIKELASQGKISAADVRAAFTAMSSEGGQFANLMEAQSLTTQGRFSTLKDSITLLAEEMGTALLPAANALIDIFSKVAEFIGSLDPTFIKFIGIAGAVASAIALIAGPILLLIGFIPSIVAGWAALTTVVTTVGAALGGVAAVISGPVVIGIGLAIAAGFLLMKNWDKVVGFVTKLWAGFKEVIGANIDIMIGEFMVLAGALKFVAGTLKRIFLSIKLAFMEAINAMIDILERFINEGINKFVNAFPKVAQFLGIGGGFNFQVPRFDTEATRQQITQLGNISLAESTREGRERIAQGQERLRLIVENNIQLDGKDIQSEADQQIRTGAAQ